MIKDFIQTVSLIVVIIALAVAIAGAIGFGRQELSVEILE